MATQLVQHCLLRSCETILSIYITTEQIENTDCPFCIRMITLTIRYKIMIVALYRNVITFFVYSILYYVEHSHTITSKKKKFRIYILT